MNETLLHLLTSKLSIKEKLNFIFILLMQYTIYNFLLHDFFLRESTMCMPFQYLSQLFLHKKTLIVGFVLNRVIFPVSLEI